MKTSRELSNALIFKKLAEDALRYMYHHGRWIFTKNAKNLLLAVQIEKTEINILQKEWGGGGKAFLPLKIKKKNSFESH